MTNKYEDKQVEDFIELATEVGISRAMRELKYPNSWNTANNWLKARGITVTVDSLKASAAATREWYKDEEALLVAQAGMERVYEKLVEEDLDADSMKKLAEAYQKYANTYLLLKGKATDIKENRETSEMDLEIKNLIQQQENMNNKIIEKETAELAK